MFYRSHKIKSLNVKIVTAMLSFAYLSLQERDRWKGRNEPYLSVIGEILHKQSREHKQFSQFYNDSKGKDLIPYLHTGSIGERLGKPSLMFPDFDEKFRAAYPCMKTDHDVMFGFEDLVFARYNLRQISSIWYSCHLYS